MALEVDRKQALGAAILFAVVAVVAFWYFWWRGQETHAAELQTSLDSLSRQVNIAKRDLARGTVADLRARIAGYQASLQLMREFVPTGSEVPSLIDDIRRRADNRGVHVAELAPLAVESGYPFETNRYRAAVVGHYDEIGRFLTDIASLPRIMVPDGLTLALASSATTTAYSDTSGALLEASFQIRTFVKSQAPPAGATTSGTP